jgi:NADPH:quinone reductase
MMVLFRQSSGSVPPFNPSLLNAKGSLYFTRPGIGHYTSIREELQWRAGDILNWISEGSLKVRVDHNYPLKEAEEAHRALKTRLTAG